MEGPQMMQPQQMIIMQAASDATKPCEFYDCTNHSVGNCFYGKVVVWLDVLSTFALQTQDLKVACWLERNIIFADNQLYALNASQKQRKKV